MITVKHDGYSVTIEEPTVYVDNKARHRSGHMTHGLATFDGKRFIDFNSNCSAERADGHSTYGWLEYRTSEDAGKTYSAVQTLPLSWEMFLDGVTTMSIESVVATDTGRLVATVLMNNALDECCCEPWFPPKVITSDDFGKTWSDLHDLSPYPGRPYSACYKNGKVFVLHFCNEHFLGSAPEHLYRLYVSTDNGESFEERSVIAFPDTNMRGYGALLFGPDGVLHAYAYNGADEAYVDHVISRDEGKTWEVCEPAGVARGLRNPHMACLDGVFIAHGRSSDAKGFVVYSSLDGYTWDEGVVTVSMPELCGAFYSNNVVLEDEKGKFLLVQYSSPYQIDNPYWNPRVDVMHTRVRIVK